MSDCLEGTDAVPVRGYHIYYREEAVTFWYPPVPVEGKNVASSPDPQKVPSGQGREKRKPEGRSFHHGKFVMKLRDAASREPMVTMVETTAMELRRDDKLTQVVGVKCLSGGKNPQCVFNSSLFPVYRLEILSSEILPVPLICPELTRAQVPCPPHHHH
jgi:squalene monooxygenase